jgi:hypothetical protein
MTILHIAACENCVKSADYIIQNSLAPIIDAQTEDVIKFLFLLFAIGVDTRTYGSIHGTF